MRVLLTILILFFIQVFPAKAQDDFFKKLSDAAIELTNQEVKYDPGYYKIDYPNGDVPANIGVCTDVIIRAYRKLGIDLQKEVHEDMEVNFGYYPKIWGLSRTDTNIDHRRVPNLMVFFERNGTPLEITDNAADYLVGDIVSWDLGGNIPHIGIVVDKKSKDKKRFQVVHNIGNGQEISDCLFDFEITGHYRYSKTNNDDQ